MGFFLEADKQNGEAEDAYEDGALLFRNEMEKKKRSILLRMFRAVGEPARPVFFGAAKIHFF